MDLGIEGKVAVVTASTAGLGLACALALLEEGTFVVLNGRDAGRLRGLDLPADRALVVEGDVTESETRRAIVDTAATFGVPQILVGNTPGPPPSRATDSGPDDLAEAARTLLVPQVDLVSRVLDGMVDSRWGRIVFITSGAVREPVEGLVASNSLRMAVHGYAKTLSREVAEYGVTVNCVMPGRIDTERVRALDRAAAERTGRKPDEVRAANEASIPARRYGKPHELGALVAFLCSERASYISGAAIPVDGGLLRSHF